MKTFVWITLLSAAALLAWFYWVKPRMDKMKQDAADALQQALNNKKPAGIDIKIPGRPAVTLSVVSQNV